MEYLLIARSMPPIVTWLGSSAFTRGYCVHLKDLKRSGLFVFIDG